MNGGAANLARAREVLHAGGLVVVPTETVYGLAADAANAAAVAALYALKARPHFNPLIAHCADQEAAEREVALPPLGRKLAERFWPGPLTLVAPRRPNGTVCPLARAGLDTVAVRVPAHPLFHALLTAFGRPLAAPSANASGRLSPTRPEHVRAAFQDRTPLILDGGPCTFGLESTVIGFEGARAVLLRAGALAREQIEALSGPLATPQSAIVSSPGQLLAHYAPKARLRLNAVEALPGETLLGFGSIPGALSLSRAGELAEAAAHLFDYLHRLDAAGATCIAVAPIPNHGLGEAINDRLARAAAAKDGP